MKCRNKLCGSYCSSDEQNKCRKCTNVIACAVYNRLLPLWEFQDKWEDTVESAFNFKYEITEVFDGKYFGRVKTRDGWFSCSWNYEGKSEQTTSFNLIPKSKKLKLPEEVETKAIGMDYKSIIDCIFGLTEKTNEIINYIKDK